MAREMTRKSWEKWRKIADDLEITLDYELPKSQWTKAALLVSIGRAITDEFGEDIDMEIADVAACFAALPKSELEKALAPRYSRRVGNKWRWRDVDYCAATWWNAAALARDNDLPVWKPIEIAWNRRTIRIAVESADMWPQEDFGAVLAKFGHLAVA